QVERPDRGTDAQVVVDAAHTGLEASGARATADETVGLNTGGRGRTRLSATVALGALSLAGENAHAPLLLGAEGTVVAFQELVHAGIVGNQRGFVHLDGQSPNEGEVRLHHREPVLRSSGAGRQDRAAAIRVDLDDAARVPPLRLNQIGRAHV